MMGKKMDRVGEMGVDEEHVGDEPVLPDALRGR